MTLAPGLRWVVEACRAAESGPEAAFAAGARFRADELDDFVPAHELQDLRASGLIVEDDTGSGFALRCANFNNLVSIMPGEQGVGADFVHLNADTLWLLQLVWKHARPGETAVELGTGNGIVAAHLVARYQRVLATDLPGPWMQFARLTLAANAGRGRPSAVIASDVASALRPQSFDLVAANSPWSPAVPLDSDGNRLTFMDGGPTGTELPARFLLEGAELLAPGGTAITLCLDPTFDDGRRPLQPVLDQLRTNGFTVECVPSAVFEPEIVTSKLRAGRLPTLAHAAHIAVITRRPLGSDPDDDKTNL